MVRHQTMDELDTVVHDTISEVTVNQWDNLVAQLDQGGVSHRSGWLKAVEAGLDVGLAHVGVYDDGNPIAVFPNVVTDVEVPDWWSLVENADFRDGRYKYKERYGGSAVPTFPWERGYERPLWPLYRSAWNLYWRITQ